MLAPGHPLAGTGPSDTHHSPAAHVAACPARAHAPQEEPRVPTPHSAGWAASDTRMCTGGTASCCAIQSCHRHCAWHSLGLGNANHHSPKTSTVLPGQDSASMLVHIRELIFTSCPQFVTGHCPAHTGELRASVQTVARGLPRPAPTSTLETAATILCVAQWFRGSTEHRLRVPVPAALSNTPCQLGPAGLRTSLQSPGLHPSARSASQHQQRTRVPLHTEKRDSTT